MKTTLKKTFRGFDFPDDDEKKKFDKVKIGDLVNFDGSIPRDQRSIDQLRTYKKAIKVFADNTDNEYFDTALKADMLLKIKFNFLEDKVVVPVLCGCGTKHEKVCFIPKTLAFTKAKHKESTEYISKALEYIADKLGCADTEDLIQKMFDFEGA